MDGKLIQVKDYFAFIAFRGRMVSDPLEKWKSIILLSVHLHCLHIIHFRQIHLFNHYIIDIRKVTLSDI